MEVSAALLSAPACTPQIGKEWQHKKIAFQGLRGKGLLESNPCRTTISRPRQLAVVNDKNEDGDKKPRGDKN
jgi:hypothetical protein